MRILKASIAVMAMSGLLVNPGFSWAATATAQATVSATIPLSATISLARDTNSVARGSVSQVLFDKRDDQDTGVAAPNAGFMYAPYRSEINRNWHVANIVATGSSMTLSLAVTGTIGSTPLSSILRVWCGGFFLPGATTAIPGTATSDDGDPKTDDWNYVSGFQRSLNRAFTGTVPFNYRLDIAGLPAGGPYTGTITFTLTST